jgi:hypothetical protein
MILCPVLTDDENRVANAADFDRVVPLFEQMVILYTEV